MKKVLIGIALGSSLLYASGCIENIQKTQRMHTFAKDRAASGKDQILIDSALGRFNEFFDKAVSICDKKKYKTSLKKLAMNKQYWANKYQ